MGRSEEIRAERENESKIIGRSDRASYNNIVAQFPLHESVPIITYVVKTNIER